MATFEQLMNGFGVVTVMNACIYELAPDKRYAGRSACQHNSAQGGALLPSDWLCTGEYLDTLKIANLNQEGPTKTVTGGQYANPLIKYGKTCTAEMQDALGRASTMVRFFGADYCTKVKYEQGKSYSRDIMVMVRLRTLSCLLEQLILQWLLSLTGQLKILMLPRLLML